MSDKIRPSKKDRGTPGASTKAPSVPAAEGVPTAMAPIPPVANLPSGPSEAERAAAQAERQEFIDLRKLFMEGEQKSYESFDKAILTLSGTAFAFSLTLVQFLASARHDTWYLLIAWFFYIGSLLLILTSFLASQHAFRQQIAALDQQYIGGAVQQSKNIADIVTAWLNWISALAFIAGSIFLALFVYSNLPV